MRVSGVALWAVFAAFGGLSTAQAQNWKTRVLNANGPMFKSPVNPRIGAVDRPATVDFPRRVHEFEMPDLVNGSYADAKGTVESESSLRELYASQILNGAYVYAGQTELMGGSVAVLGVPAASYRRVQWRVSGTNANIHSIVFYYANGDHEAFPVEERFSKDALSGQLAIPYAGESRPIVGIAVLGDTDYEHVISEADDTAFVESVLIR